MKVCLPGLTKAKYQVKLPRHVNDPNHFKGRSGSNPPGIQVLFPSDNQERVIVIQCRPGSEIIQGEPDAFDDSPGGFSQE